MSRVGLFARGLRHRLGPVVFLLLAELLAVLGATLGPIYLGSSQNSVLVSGLRREPVSMTGVTVFSQEGATKRQLDKAIGGLAPLTRRHLLERPILSAYESVSVIVPKGTKVSLQGEPIQSLVVERSGACRHLRLVLGHCPSTRDEVLLSLRSARAIGAHLGTVLALAPSAVPVSAGVLSYLHLRTIRVKVSGLYALPSQRDPYWWGETFASFGTTPSGVLELDGLFVTPGFFHGAGVLGGTTKIVGDEAPVSRLAQFPLDRAVVTRPLAAKIPGLLAEASGRVSFAGLALGSRLGSVLGAIARSETAMTKLVTIVILELVLVAMIVFGTLIWRMGVARSQEFRLAQLRGLRARRVIARALAEPLVLLLVAVPLGTLAAWQLVGILGHRYFAPGTARDFPPATMVAAAAVVVVALVVASVGGIVALRQGALEVTRTALRSRGRVRLLVEGLVVVVAALLTAQLVIAPTSGAGVDPLAGAAPAFLGAGVAVVAIVLVGLALRGVARLTAHSRRVPLYLAARQLRARSAMQRQIIPLGMALAVVVFGVGTVAVVVRHERTVAGWEVGAGKVLTVTVPGRLGLVQAVDRADPSGRYAMAAELYRASSGTTLALQASRLAKVASWPTADVGVSAATAARDLGPFAPAVVHVGPRISFTATLAGSLTPASAPELEVSYLDTANGTPVDDFEGLAARTTPVALATGCQPDQCDLLGIGLDTSAVVPNQGAIVLTHLAGIEGMDPLAPRNWSSAQGIVVKRATGGIALTWSGGPPTGLATPARYGTSMPALVTRAQLAALSESVLGAARTGSVPGLDGGTITIRPVLTLPSLPEVGGDATIVDLSRAEVAQTSTSLAADQIWLAAGAPPRVLAALKREGVRVLATASASALATRFAGEPLGLAERLFPTAAVAAAVVVLLGFAFELFAEGRGRLAEFAAIRMLGLPRRRLVVSYAIEGGILVLTAALTGVVAGLVGARLALPALPELSGGYDGLRVGYGLPVGLEVATVAAVVVVALVVGVAIAVRVVGRASFDQLRAGER